MSNKKHNLTDEEYKKQYALNLLTSKDPEILREMLITSLNVINLLHRQAQMHKLLHPLVFFAGFLTCYYFFL